MPKSRTIIFFGPDGAGKTTQANLLVHELISRGVRVKRCWIRSLHLFAYFLSLPLSLRLGLRDPRYFRSRYANNRYFRKVWSFLEFASIIPLILTRMYIPLALGYTVVAERFVIDSVVSLAYSLNEGEVLSGMTARILLSTIPRNANLIYLDCDYENIVRRENIVLEPRAFIEFQRKWYSAYANLLGAAVYNTAEASPKEIFEKINLTTSKSDSR